MTSASTDRRQGVRAGSAIKVPVRVATTANITLSGLQTIDGVALSEDDRVLVKDQTDATENGIYEADSSTWDRAIDFDGAFDVVQGTLVLVTQGSTNAETMWRVSTSGTITVGDTELEFEPSVIDDAAGASFTQSGTGGGTGASIRTVQDKGREIPSVEDYSSAGGVADQWQKAIDDNYGRTLHARATSYSMDAAVNITDGIKIHGSGLANCVISRAFSPGGSNNTQGVFNLSGGADVEIDGFSIQSLSGQSGGCLLSAIADSSNAPSLVFRNLYLTTTGTDTHNYTVYVDGTAKSSAPIGIRSIHFENCNVFGAATKALLLKGVVHGSFIGGSVIVAGGTSGKVHFSGDATVKTQDIIFAPQDIPGGIDFDFATKIKVVTGEIATGITNTSDTSFVTVLGNITGGSIDDNWTSSMYVDTTNGILLPSGVSLTSRTKSTTTIVYHIGKGATAFACPNTQTFTFTMGSAKFFEIHTGGGAAALCFADFKTAAITILSDPSSEYENSSTPSAGQTGIYKSANSHVISVVNGTGSSQNYTLLAIGLVSAVTNPA